MAENEGQKALKALRNARERIAEIEKSDLHIGLRNFRNKYVAHALVETSLEAKGEVAKPKYGQERELFDQTVELMKELYFGVCNASYAWDMAREHSQRYANALLSKCQLNIVE